jgi:hypothetical protein
MEPNIDRQPATPAETETGQNKEGTGYRCPNCHTLVGLDTPQCPGCGGLFKAGISKRRQELQDNPFDPRTEISADARHIASRIVTHLWILFVLLPVILAVLLAIFGVLK